MGSRSSSRAYSRRGIGLGELRVLVVAAHGDDEVLGAGGTIAWHVRHGDAVRLCVLSDSEKTAPGLEIRRRYSPTRLTSAASKRRPCAEQAAAGLGVESFAMYQFPDNAFDSLPLLHIIYVVEDEIAGFSPDRIYTH